MATTMNPVEHYRDPSLDPEFYPSGRPQQNVSASRRGMDSQMTPTRDGKNANENGQTMLESVVPLGPPISYRGVGSSADPRIHRSFSQRAKGRPFADEAFADDDLDGYPSNKPRPFTDRLASAESPNHRPQPVVESDHSAQESNVRVQSLHKNASSTSRGKTRATIGGEIRPTRNSATFHQAATLTEDSSQHGNHQKGLTSDRSPLQKLEVKLTDISKEEKRARVREAEMRLRDFQASPITSRSQPLAATSPRSMPQQNPLESMGRPIENKTTETIGLDSDMGIRGSRRGKEGRAPLQGPIADIPVRQRQDIGQGRARLPRQSANPQPPTSVYTAPNAQSYIPRPVSMKQQHGPNPSVITGQPLTEQRRTASYEATLQQLTGEGTGSTNKQQNSQPPRNVQTTHQRTSREARPSSEQFSPVAADVGTLGGEDHFVNYTAPKPVKQPQNETSPTQHSPLVVGLGLSGPPTSRATNSHSVDNQDPIKSRQRKSSVSFQVPFETRRPIDEWKAAETARLTADDFLAEEKKASDPYKPWWEQDQSKRASRSRRSSAYTAPVPQIDDRVAVFDPPLFLKCGPLLRYTGLRRLKGDAESSTATQEFWRGTVMIVTQDSRCVYDKIPTLRLFAQPKKLLPPPPALVTGDQLAPEYIDPIAGLTKLSRTGRALYVRPVDHLEEAKDLSRFDNDNGIYEGSPSPLDINGSKDATTAASNKRTLDTDGERLGRYKEIRGVRLYADPTRDVTFWRFDLEIQLRPEQQHIAYRINKGATTGFWVPAQGQTMNIMFHSCNGFSMSVDSDSFSGPDPMWRDVLNNHQTRPFHVMIGGGDQVYNDRVMIDTHHFGEWTKIVNPHHKHHAPFTPEMKKELETFYLERYSTWFSQGLFAMANASIPMVNIWDDHDIIDGFGSYPDEFMKTPVFSGLGNIAHKYYLLFQHHSVDAITEKDEPSWILGKKPGPYIQHVSRSVYLELGQKVAFLGLDGRTERTRHDVLSIDTLELILERCRRDMTEGQTKHLIVLLGVPIAYPRLVWLENVLTSRALDPIKALHRAGIVKTKLLNKFDGGVEILDDLDDHWTASHHKDERNILIQDLQDLAAEKSARITILSGDVHLAAVGQFYSNPKLKVPKDKDHRYMPNIVSSAIVNTPPPDMLADVLNKRNRVHHLDKYTDENMIPMFTHDVDEKKRNNTRLLPRRNWCSIREYIPGETPPPTPSPSPSIDDAEGFMNDDDDQYQEQRPTPRRRLSLTKNDLNPRNLMRRISSRGAPPNSYRSANGPGQTQQRSASLDDVDQSRASYKQSPQLRSSSADHVPDVPALRPSFRRRPTNLSEKAARKGIVPGMDADGNEVHFNDHVNLESGLDIVLNCEVNQKDPAGITTQYRLLVPALWYDGSSDRERINPAPPLNRGNSFMKKFGFSSLPKNQAAESQGAGNWGQEMSETESYTGSEEEHEKPAKKKFSFFGSKRQKRSSHSNAEPTNQSAAEQTHPESIAHEPSTQRDLNNSHTPVAVRELHNDVQPYRGTSGVERMIDPPKPQNTYQPPQQLSQSSYQHPVEQLQDPLTPPVQQKPQQSLSQSNKPTTASSISQQSLQRSSRPLSYTISGSSGAQPQASARSSTQSDRRPPYDPDAAYISNQQRSTTTSMQRSDSAGYSNPGRASNFSASSSSHAQPEQRLLRGNGIIGNNIPPSSYRNSSNGFDMHNGRDESQSQVRHNSHSQSQIQPQSRPPSQSRSQSQDEPKGYSGIEAYKEPKPKRRWSLRDRARNVMGSFNSKRRKGDDEWYSDEEEEAYWEGDEDQDRNQHMDRQGSKRY